MFTTAVNNTNLNFITAGPTAGMVANPATDSITVNTFGVYEINYSLSNQIVAVGSVQYSLFLNNTTAVAASNMFFQANVALLTTRSPGSNTILITLNPSDIITVRPTAVVGVVSYGNPNLVVKKIF
ncbi:hypothetical protein [Peribacillus muralis]|uniref:hypothetical protein n=1 Tax=Peribacillus muralis TaxID=264697 RepID=UPI00366A55CE